MSHAWTTVALSVLAAVPAEGQYLLLITGDPSANIADIRNVEIVFRQGVGFDPAKLINSVKGMVGIF